MSLITKELIEHENKFNRKVFLYHESSEKRFSQFVIFCKKPQKVYHEVVYTQQNYREILISWNAWNDVGYLKMRVLIYFGNSIIVA